MTNLLDNTGLPIWVYVVLIVVGSVLLLVIVAILLRCWHVRRKAKVAEYNGLTGATRRMTVRRGRMVPTSQHLSLTGSRFGMRQFGILADNESTLTGRRSPFEWWTNMLDRSQSRQDNMSQMEAGSIFTRPSSRATTIATRRDFRSATPTRTPEKNKEPVTRTTELIIPSPLPSPTPSPTPSNKPAINFSRSFVPKGASSPLTQRSQHTLSRIEESSPHHSMLINPRHSNRSSHFAAIHPLDNTPLPGQVIDPRQSINMPRRSMTLSVVVDDATFSKGLSAFAQDQPSPTSPFLPSLKLDPNRFSAYATMKPRKIEEFNSSSPIPPRPKTADAATASRRNNSHLNSQDFSVPKLPPTLAFPKPVAQASSRRYDQPAPSPIYSQTNLQSDQSKRASTASKRDSTRRSHSLSASRKSSMSIGPSGIVYDTQLPDYWSSRTDLQDLSSTLGVGGMKLQVPGNNPKRNGNNSQDGGERESIIGVVTVPGKNNTRVLRKKSLKRLPKASPTS